MKRPITRSAGDRALPRRALSLVARRVAGLIGTTAVAASLGCAVTCACASDWYVRPNGTAHGNSAGKDWTNAFNGFSGIAWNSVACGDTVWLAGGTYTQSLNLKGKNCSTAAPLYIRRVRSSDPVPVAANGWNQVFDGVVNISRSNPGIFIQSGKSIHIDGRINYGIRVNIESRGGDGAKAATTGDIDDIRLSHIEISGPPCAPAGNCSSGAYGFNFAPSFNKVTNLLISRCSVHGVSEALRSGNWRDVVIEYTDIYDLANDGIDHEDTMYSYPSTNVTMRYNFIHNVPADGIFFEYGGAVNFRLYGNVFYNSRLSLLTTKAPGNYGPMYIYNNVFAAPSATRYGWIHSNDLVTTEGTEVANNVFYFVSNGFPNSHHNAYNYTYLNGYAWPSKEAGSFTFTGSGGMANIAAGDAHLDALSVLRNRGSALVSDGYLNVDMEGNKRGADGAWDVGAFEFGAGESRPSPVVTPRRPLVER